MKIRKPDGVIEISVRAGRIRVRTRRFDWRSDQRKYIIAMAQASNTCADFEHASGYEYQ